MNRRAVGQAGKGAVHSTRRELRSTVDIDKPLYAEDVARLEGISIEAARRRLVALERKHGEGVVCRIPGNGMKHVRRYTTARAMEKVVRHTDVWSLRRSVE